MKRIRPDALGPFDYENENYTKLLWVAEGLTSYYEGILLRRAGLITDKEFLDGKASMIEAAGPTGRFETSLEEASMEAWISIKAGRKFGKPPDLDYDKGDIVSMMMM